MVSIEGHLYCENTSGTVDVINQGSNTVKNIKAKGMINAIHFKDKYLILTTQDYHILKLDLKNEFNELGRIKMKNWTHGLIEWDDNSVLLD
eukprot:CAMPEP_0170552402 /NCGR_PEP_ID=MMETSP0211-20121228/10297_1 /TAXON_ID=311385 /ORGANISM="Pseudokeronopsis sp., Strain OXSARD2" /LENGTH=90 /DNA_ID=CAMNT_0010860109 /DNA_START=581 /DNA_END=853 /DNA_ORIENTATION=-